MLTGTMRTFIAMLTATTFVAGAAWAGGLADPGVGPNVPQIKPGIWRLEMLAPDQMPMGRACLAGNMTKILAIRPNCRKQSYARTADGFDLFLSCSSGEHDDAVEFKASGDFSRRFRIEVLVTTKDPSVPPRFSTEYTYVGPCAASDVPIDR